MPLLPSEHFLLWQEASSAKRWDKLLSKRLTKTRWIAILMLQVFAGWQPLKPAETREALLSRAITDGWGLQAGSRR